MSKGILALVSGVDQLLSVIGLLLGGANIIKLINFSIITLHVENNMKKYILSCLLASTTLLASMQSYAIACNFFPPDSQEWKACIEVCKLLPISPKICL
ncbi:hypothetical protein [Xenorhabdus bovienii]|nr:hypothetical protein [Xenorhabdus bovienii]